MQGDYNSLKVRALSAFENRGWLSPRSWATLAKFDPVRAAYSYLWRLYKWKLLDRAFDERGMLLYRMNGRGVNRLVWLRKQIVGIDAGLADVERQLENLTEAVAMGGNLSTLVCRLQQLEDQRQDLLRQRDDAPLVSPLARLDWRVIERQAREKLNAWRSLVTRHVADGRKLLGASWRGRSCSPRSKSGEVVVTVSGDLRR